MPFNLKLKHIAWLVAAALGLFTIAYIGESGRDLGVNLDRSILGLDDGSVTEAPTADQTVAADPATGAELPDGQTRPAEIEPPKIDEGSGWAAAAASVAVIALILIALLTERGERTRRKIGHALSMANLSTYATWAAIFLSIASLATTYLGMKNFHVHWMFAFVSSLGIQILLFVSSWIFAEALANRRHLKRLRREHNADDDSDIYANSGSQVRRRAMRQATAKSDGAILLMATVMVLGSMGVSVFFSLDSLFDTVYLPENRQLTNMKVARSDIGGLFDNLEEKVEKANSDELATLVASDAWEAWNTNLNTIMTAAGNQRGIIAAAVEREQNEAQAALDAASRQANETTNIVAQLRAQLEASGGGAQQATSQTNSPLQARINERENELQTARADVRTLEREVSDWDAQIEEEISAGGEDDSGNRRAAGCGPVCRSLQRERNAVQARLNVAERRVTSLESDIAELRGNQQQALSDQQSLSGRLQTAQANEDAARAALTRATENHQRVFANGATVSDPTQAGGAVAGIRDSLSEFLSTARASSLDNAVASCNSIFNTLNSNVTTRPAVAEASCDIAGIAPNLERLRQHEEAMSELGTQCQVDEEFLAFDSVRQIVDKARRCVNLSGLSFDVVKDERDTVDTVEQENSENSSRFEVTISTLSRGETLSYLTLFIAVFMDMFVLGSAVVGARTMTSALEADGEVGSQKERESIELLDFANSTVRHDDPPNIVNQKQFLSVITHQVSFDGSDVEQVIDMNGPSIQALPEGTVRTLNLQMASLSTKGLAAPVPEEPGVYVIKSAYVTHTAEQVAVYERDRFARQSFAAPSTGPGKSETAMPPVRSGTRAGFRFGANLDTNSASDGKVGGQDNSNRPRPTGLGDWIKAAGSKMTDAPRKGRSKNGPDESDVLL